jgi:integrase
MPRRLPGVSRYTTKDGRALWQYVHDLGDDPATGKRRQRRKRGFATQLEAAEALTEERRAIRRGTYVTVTDRRFGDYLHDWLATRSSNGLKPKTVASYRQVITDYIEPHLGQVPIQALTAVALDGLYATLLEEGGKRRRGLSNRSVRYTHTIIRAALGDATKKGLLPRNVALLADPPSARSAKAPEPKTWTPEELALFLRETRDHRRGPLFHVAALTGLRRGELCALTWDDIDFEVSELRVRQSLTAPDGIPHFGPPKSDKSRRTVSLDAGTVERLRDQQARSHDLRISARGEWRETGLVFINEEGNHLHPDNVSRDFSRAVQALDGQVSEISIHGLRHTHATHLLATGANPKLVADRLGHHSVAFTLDTYTHVMPGQQADAAAAVAELLKPGNAVTRPAS